jgi:hypothetical protein
MAGHRYGWPSAPRHFCRLLRPSGALVELPLPTWSIGPLQLPIAGGGYQRVLPESYIHAGLRRLNRAGRPFVIYIHPWELDPLHPRIPVGRHVAWSHYANLKDSRRRFARLLAEFRFGPLQDLALGPWASSLPDVALVG